MAARVILNTMKASHCNSTVNQQAVVDGESALLMTYIVCAKHCGQWTLAMSGARAHLGSNHNLHGKVMIQTSLQSLLLHPTQPAHTSVVISYVS